MTATKRTPITAPAGVGILVGCVIALAVALTTAVAPSSNAVEGRPLTTTEGQFLEAYDIRPLTSFTDPDGRQLLIGKRDGDPRAICLLVLSDPFATGDCGEDTVTVTLAVDPISGGQPGSGGPWSKVVYTLQRPTGLMIEDDDGSTVIPVLF